MDITLNENCISTRRIILYKKATGKSGRTWVYPLIANAGDDIHVSADPVENKPGYIGFRGYGGSTLKFNIDDGSVLELKGPWHSNADALYDDTGVDLRDAHLTFVVIAKDRKWNENSMCVFLDVLYKDDVPQIGSFDRGTLLAMKMSKELGIPLALFTESTGGSSNGFVYPDQIDVHGKRRNNDY